MKWDERIDFNDLPEPFKSECIGTKEAVADVLIKLLYEKIEECDTRTRLLSEAITTIRQWRNDNERGVVEIVNILRSGAGSMRVGD